MHGYHTHVFRLGRSAELFSILRDASGSQKSKMSAHEPEILVSQHVYNIVAAQLQRQIPKFSRSRNSMKRFSIYCVMAFIEDGDSHTGNTHVCESQSWIPDSWVRSGLSGSGLTSDWVHEVGREQFWSQEFIHYADDPTRYQITFQSPWFLLVWSFFGTSVFSQENHDLLLFQYFQSKNSIRSCVFVKCARWFLYTCIN